MYLLPGYKESNEFKSIWQEFSDDEVQLPSPRPPKIYSFTGLSPDSKTSVFFHCRNACGNIVLGSLVEDPTYIN